MVINNRFSEVVNNEEKQAWTEGARECFILFKTILNYTDDEFARVFGTSIKDIKDLVKTKTVQEVFAKVECYENKNMKQELASMINKYGKENIKKAIDNM